MRPRRLSSWLQASWLVLLPVVVVAVTAFATASIEKAAEQRAFERIQHSQRLLSVWSDRSNALRVFLQTGDPGALASFHQLAGPFQAALHVERIDARGVGAAQPVLATEQRSVERWETLSGLAVANIQQHGVRPLPIAVSKPRSDAGAAFQDANERYASIMDARRRSEIDSASHVGIGIIAFAVLVLAIAALVVTRASRGREKRLTDEQLLVLDRQRRALDDAQRLARVGSWSWNTEVDEAVWTAEMYSLFGRDPGLGPPATDAFLARVHPDDREQLAAGYFNAFGGGSPFELDYRIVLDGGETRTFHGLGHRDPDYPGVYVGTVQDVTELREVERQLRRERDYGAAITSSMREGFMLTGDGTILEVNQALCDLTGFTRADLVGASIPYPFWSPEAAEEIARERSLIDEYGGEFETSYQRKDGTRFDASVSAVAARTADGELLGYASTVRDVSERKRHVAELERLASRDPLTGLVNHRVLHQRLQVQAEHARREGQPLSIAILDLDNFKAINDKYGHLIGDGVLRELGRRLLDIKREGELIARVGGEEFAWILNAEGQDAFIAAERGRHEIMGTPFPDVGFVTVSIGICDLSTVADPQDLYERADDALYRAKRRGRNWTCQYVPGDDHTRSHLADCTF
jgi:diguanylate cyclase (GGDEF)-like protein/PAS domain S-box-containing protein